MSRIEAPWVGVALKHYSEAADGGPMGIHGWRYCGTLALLAALGMVLAALQAAGGSARAEEPSGIAQSATYDTATCGWSEQSTEITVVDTSHQHRDVPFTSDRRAFGLNVWTVQDLDAATDAIGAEPAIVGIFRDWHRDADFDAGTAASIRDRGGVPLIAWEPWDSWHPDMADTRYSPQSIAAGQHDDYIDVWAAQVRDYGGPVLIRFAPEQNGDWRPWSIGANGVTGADYQAMWRQVVDRFRAAGASNAYWVWNPIVEVGGSTPMIDSFPGADYVDYIGLDGYNWGDSRPWGWQSYDDIFTSSVTLIREFAPQTPWLLAEVGSAPGPDRAEWVTALFERAATDGAAGLVWFEFDKETDWRLAADDATAAAALGAIRNGGWLTGAP